MTLRQTVGSIGGIFGPVTAIQESPSKKSPENAVINVNFASGHTLAFNMKASDFCDSFAGKQALEMIDAGKGFFTRTDMHRNNLQRIPLDDFVQELTA